MIPWKEIIVAANALFADEGLPSEYSTVVSDGTAVKIRTDVLRSDDLIDLVFPQNETKRDSIYTQRDSAIVSGPLIKVAGSDSSLGKIYADSVAVGRCLELLGSGNFMEALTNSEEIWENRPRSKYADDAALISVRVTEIMRDILNVRMIVPSKTIREVNKVAKKYGIFFDKKKKLWVTDPGKSEVGDIYDLVAGGKYGDGSKIKEANLRMAEQSSIWDRGVAYANRDDIVINAMRDKMIWGYYMDDFGGDEYFDTVAKIREGMADQSLGGYYYPMGSNMTSRWNPWMVHFLLHFSDGFGGRKFGEVIQGEDSMAVKAIRIYGDIILNRPDDPLTAIPHALVGSIYESHGHFDDAIMHYESALKLLERYTYAPNREILKYRISQLINIEKN